MNRGRRGRQYGTWLKNPNPQMPPSTKRRLEANDDVEQDGEQTASNVVAVSNTQDVAMDVAQEILTQSKESDASFGSAVASIGPTSEEEMLNTGFCETELAGVGETSSIFISNSEQNEVAASSSLPETPQSAYEMNNWSWDKEDDEQDSIVTMGLEQRPAEQQENVPSVSVPNTFPSQHSTESFDSSKKKKKPRKQLDNLLCSELSITRFECLLLCVHFAMRHGLTTYGISDLMRVINEICGQEALPERYETFKDIFKGSCNLQYYFCCINCGRLLREMSTFKDKFVKCNVCKKVCSVGTLTENNFFVYISVEDQLRNLFENTPNILDILNYRNMREVSDDTIQDVFDGSLHKFHSQPGGILSDSQNFSVTINTDGSPVFKSANNTMYPVQFRMNEVPPDVRFESWNCLVAGIWFGKHDPEMSALLQPFIKEAQNLYEHGFTWKSRDGEYVTSRMLVLNNVLDSVAKPKVQGTTQFNGYEGCNYCIHPGIKIEDHPHPRYLMPDDDFDVNINAYYESEYSVTWCNPRTKTYKVVSVSDRTDGSIRKVMHDIHTGKTKGLVKGVLGCSPLFPLFWFDLIFGFCIDYMHAVLIGVCKHVTRLQVAGFGMPYYIGDKMKTLNERMAFIKPASSISRRPRKFEDFVHWKANEWRAYLLYYSLPCLVGVLPPNYLRHHCLLVSAIFILLQDSITRKELWQAAVYLKRYVCDFQHLYGAVNMHFNLHLLLHLCKCVNLNGPLWSFSAFCFEAGNGRLLKLVKGARYVAKQIAEKYVDWSCIPETISMYKVSDSILDFCDKMFSFSRSMFSLKVDDSVTLLSDMVRFHPTPDEEKAFMSAGVRPQFSFVKMIKDGTMYFADFHRRKNVGVNDSAVKLMDNSYAYIERIVNVAIQNVSTVYLVCRTLNFSTSPIVNHENGACATHIKLCPVVIFGEICIIPAKHVKSKVILIMDDGKTLKDSYIVEMLNHLEKD